MQNSIVRPLGRDMQNVLIGFVGEHEARTFFVRTRDDLTGYTISLVIGDVDCGAMTKAPMPDGSTMLSLTLTSDMLGNGGEKVCQLLMVKNTIVRKSSQFRAYVGASNDINSTAPDSATIIIISEKITELVHEAALDAIAEVQEVIDSIPADYSELSAQVDTNTEDIGGLKADLADNVNDLKSALNFDEYLINAEQYTIKASDLESGAWGYSSKIANAARARSKFLIPVRAGMIISYANTTFDISYGVLETPTSNTYIANNSGWKTDASGIIKITADGYMAFMIRNHADDTATVDPADYDSVVTIKTVALQNIADVEREAANLDVVFDTFGWEVGGINGTTGEDFNNSTRVRTGFISVMPGTQYDLLYTGLTSILPKADGDRTLYVLQYDTDKAFISLSTIQSLGVIGVGGNTAFIRMALQAQNETVTVQEAEAYHIKIYKINEFVTQKINGVSMSGKQSFKSYIADVPFDTYGWEQGQISGIDGGNLTNFDNYVRTDFFEVTPGATYHFSHTGDLTGYVFWVYCYTAEKKYTRYLAPLVTSDLQVGDTEKYWRLRLSNGDPITPEDAESFHICFTGAKGALATTVNDLVCENKISDIEWESGGINGLTGEDIVNANRSRTGFFQVVPEDSYFVYHNPFNGAILYAVYYAENTTSTFYGIENLTAKTKFAIPVGVNYVRFVVQKNNATIDPEIAASFDIRIYKADGALFDEIDHINGYLIDEIDHINGYLIDEIDHINGYLIEQPDIQELPSSLVAMPDVGYIQGIPSSSGISVAKSAIYKNGDHFCVTYGENVDGTANDFPTYSESGGLKMSYKLFDLVDDVESNASFGTLAEKGDTYIDRNNESQTMPGGCGLPSGVNNMQYFTVPYERTDNDPSYTAYNFTNYGMIPMVSAVSLANDGTVSFGTPHELILVIDNTAGEFNMRRIDADYQTSLSYITTTPPYYDGEKYHWLQIITNGFAYLQSTDGVTWTYITSVKTPFQAMREIVCVTKGTYLYFAARVPARTMGGDKIASDYLCIGRCALSSVNVIRFLYKLPFIESRPNLTISGNDILLFYTPGSKKITKCLRIVEGQYNTEIFFWDWFTIYRKCTWYLTCYAPSVADANFTDMYLCGGSYEGPTTGADSQLTFLHLKFDSLLPKKPNGIPFAVGSDADFDANDLKKAEIFNVNNADTDTAKDIYVSYPYNPASIFIFGRATIDANHLIVADIVTVTNSAAPIMHLGTNSSITATRIDGKNIKLQVPEHSYISIVAPAKTKFVVS